MQSRLTKQKSGDERCQIPGANRERVESGRANLFSDDTAIEVAEIFRALGDSSRIKIVYSLLKQELCTCDLAAIIGSSESSVSQHLRILRQLRLVKSQRRGKQVFYSLDDAHIRTLLVVCLSHVHDADQHQEELGRMLELFTIEQDTPTKL
ncbi:ArsR/SmtB family transcription factor [Ktedonobacter racemifer]|uniref:Transcriptional regulator, ArsR family n=1 Tax=Ktedonobacter racemifer DSM 44963 TaxID=485913 RepID=D6TER6_KTERA|nr:metalloregulator ArsR/SmtB family transcription factor [Ktedonobacter racemifer]EFH88515.1 transcriptional regulator, ArsR family [Ktedonobacter racemifer DSM 44963]